MIDIDTRLRVARGIDKTETEASIRVFETLKRRGHPDRPPPTMSDGWGGIDEAMIRVYGQAPHPIKGKDVHPQRSVQKMTGNIYNKSKYEKTGKSSEAI